MAQQKVAQTEDNLGQPLFPSEKNNAILATRKLRDVATRYKDGISSTPVSRPSSPKRSPSPTAARPFHAPAMLLPKRVQSAERRPVTPTTQKLPTPSSPSRPSTPPSPSLRSCDSLAGLPNTTRRLHGNRTTEGLWPSLRSLSSSLQPEPLAGSISKSDKSAVDPSSDKRSQSSASVAPERKRTPLRGRNTSEQLENYKPLENPNIRAMEQHRWPAMLGSRLSSNALVRGVDHFDKGSRSTSLIVTSRGSVSPKSSKPAPDSAIKSPQLSFSEMAEQLLCSGGETIKQQMNSIVNSSMLPFESCASTLRPIRTRSSPILALHRPLSPIKVLSTSSPMTRVISSPSKTRPSTPTSPFGNASSRSSGISCAFNYTIDAWKGKKNRNHMEGAHKLRVFHNAYLQWRFINAQSKKTSSIQKLKAQNILYSGWNSISELHNLIVTIRTDVYKLQQNLNLGTILDEQVAHLKDYETLEREYSSSLSGLANALNATQLRLPLIEGAKANVLDVKIALISSIDVMNTMGSPICSLLSKLKCTLPLVSELSAIVAKEKFALDECLEVLASAEALQVEESSLRTHVIQLRQDARQLY